MSDPRLQSLADTSSPLRRSTRAISGLGRISLIYSESTQDTPAALHALAFPDVADQPLIGADCSESRASTFAASIFDQLQEYAHGKRRTFSITTETSSLPAFTHRVLAATARIPWGSTLTYSELATRLKNPKASRAVGQAMGRNPIPIIIPCHRVVAATGMGGFSCGLAIKERLLAIEQVTMPHRGRR